MVEKINIRVQPFRPDFWKRMAMIFAKKLYARLYLNIYFSLLFHGEHY